MASHALVEMAFQLPCEWLRSWIEATDRHALSRKPEWQLEIAVIRDHDGRIDVATEDVEQQMGGDVHVRALLLAVQMRDDEPRSRDVCAGGLLDLHRPLRRDRLRTTLRIPTREHRRLTREANAPNSTWSTLPCWRNAQM
jgi:hypothetical protein